MLAKSPTMLNLSSRWSLHFQDMSTVVSCHGPAQDMEPICLFDNFLPPLRALSQNFYVTQDVCLF